MSEDRKVKVFNRSKGHHDFVCMDRNKIIPIPAGSFARIPIDEIYYGNATSKSFKRGILEIDASETELLEELGFLVRNPNAYSVEELEKLLSGNLTKDTKEKLSGITERHAKQKLIDVARKLDLTQSKIDFIEEVTGMEVINEIIKEEKKQEKLNKKEKK